MTQLERRKFKRFLTDVDLWWSRDRHAERVRMLDISAGGMLCSFPQEQIRGQKVRLQIEMPGEVQLIWCCCRVAHCRTDGKGRYLVGLEIQELDGVDQVTFVYAMRGLQSVGR